MISLIFMLALNEQSQNEFQRVYRIISSLDIISQIEKAENVDTIFHLLKNA
jgi:mannitol/fructose-specific phosphotransferase system IIA component (Ntr-type)